MSKRQKTLLKQKLIGVAVVIFSLLTIIPLEGDATVAVAGSLFGFLMIFDKEPNYELFGEESEES